MSYDAIANGWEERGGLLLKEFDGVLVVFFGDGRIACSGVTANRPLPWTPQHCTMANFDAAYAEHLARKGGAQ